MNASGETRGGYVRAALGATVGVVALGLLAAFLVEPTVGGATPKQLLSFDHDGILELDALLIYLVVAVAIVIGAPLGCWLALRAGREPRAGVTALLLPILLWGVTIVVLRVVPSAPGDPVIEPYAITLGAFLSGLLARAFVLLTLVPSDARKGGPGPNG